VATMTLRNVPDELVEDLKKEARDNRRSLNQEVIARLLERRGGASNPDALLARIVHNRRQAPAIETTPEELKKWIGRGRL